MIELVYRRSIAVVERTFFWLLFAYTALGTCNLTYGKPIISVVMYAAFLVGGYIFATRVLNFREYDRMPGIGCALLLWFCYIMSMALNMQYFAKSNLVFFILWTFYFFVLYTHHNGKKVDSIIKEFSMVSTVFLIWNTILVIISLYMLFSGYSKVYVDYNNGRYEVASGMFAGRLWGAYQDPNLGSVMCCAAIAQCVYWFRKRKSTFIRSLLVIVSLLSLAYMALSDSRNGMVCLGALLSLSFGLVWFGRKPFGVTRVAAGAAIFMLLFVVGAGTPKLIQTGYNHVIALQASVGNDLTEDLPEYETMDKNFSVTEGETLDSAQTQQGFTEKAEHTDNIPEQETHVAEDVTESALQKIDRGYDLTADFSNRRIDVWKSGLEIALSCPFSGVSYAGMFPYAREFVPDTYVVIEEFWRFNTFDNELINILVFNGAVALAAVLIWFIVAVKWFVTRMRYVPETYVPELSIWFVLVCIFIVSALFQGTMFYQSTPNTLLFWISFGSLAYLLNMDTSSMKCD